MSTKLDDFDTLWDSLPVGGERQQQRQAAQPAAQDFDALWDSLDTPAAPAPAPERPSLLARVLGGSGRAGEVRALQRQMAQGTPGRTSGAIGTPPRPAPTISAPTLPEQAPSAPVGGRFRALADALSGQADLVGQQVVRRSEAAERAPGQIVQATRARDGEHSLSGGVARAVGRVPAMFVEGAGGVLSALGSAARLLDPVQFEQATGDTRFEGMDFSQPNVMERLGAAVAGAGARVQQSGPLRPSRSVEEGGAFQPRNWRWWTERGTEAIGQLATQVGTAMLTGGGGTAAQFLAFAAPTVLLEGGSAYNEIRDKLIEQGVSPEEARVAASGGALATAVGATALERLPFDAHFLFQRVPAARKVFDSAIMRRLATTPISAASEGLEEMGQEAWSMAVEYAMTHDPDAFEDWKGRLAAGGTLGALAGGVAGATLGGGRARETGAAPLDVVQAPERPVLAAGTGERPSLRRRLGDMLDPSRAAETDALRAELDEAYTDPGTGLSNSTAWGQARDRIDANPDTELAVFDLVNLKASNELVSYDFGSAELRRVADAVRQAASEMGIPVRNLFRAGGDEFVAEVPKGMAERFAARVQELAPDAPIGETEFSSGVRFGTGATFAAADAAVRAAKEQQSGPRFRTAGAPAETQAPQAGPPAHGEIRRVRTSDLTRAPELMQYKTVGIGEGGVTSELKRVRKWDPIKAGVVQVWTDPASGTTYVVNGHHRHELAERLGVPELNVQYINAPDAESARMVGALTNIAEGRGTAIDAAKVFRTLKGQGDDVAGYLEDQGVSLTGAIARDGLALSNLAPDLFTRVSTGEIPQNIGVAIGGAGLNEAQQYEVWKLANAGSRLMSAAQVEEAARYVKAAGTENVQQETLFGTETADVSLARPKIQLSAWVREQLAKEKRLFSFVGRGERARAIEAEGAGTIDTERSQQIAEQAAQAEEVFKRLSIYAGPVSDALNEAARRVVAGEKIADVRQDLYAAVREAVVAELEARQSGATGVRADTEVGDAATGTAEPVQAVDTETGDLFGEAPAPTPTDTETGDLFGAPESTPASEPTTIPAAASDSEADARRPWEMTRDEFIRAHRGQFVRQEGKRNIEGVRTLDGTSVLPLPKGAQRAGRLTRPADEILAEIHRTQVENQLELLGRSQAPNALPWERAAKPVPDAVLADYPDLSGEPAPAPAAAPAPEVAAAPDPTPEAAPEPGKIVYSKPATYQGRREIRVTREGDDPIDGPRLYIVQHEKGGKTYYIEQRTISGASGATTKVRLSDPLPLREAKKLAAELLPQEEPNPFVRGAREARQNTEPATDTPAAAESTPEPATELPFGRVGVDDETSFYGTPVEVYEPMTDSWTPGAVTRVLNGGTLIEVATDPNDPQRTFRYSAENVRRVDDAAPTAPETATADPVTEPETSPADQLRSQLSEAEARQERMAKANRIVRNKAYTDGRKIEHLRILGIEGDEAWDLIEPASGERPGYSPAALKENRAEINRLKREIEALEAVPEPMPESVPGEAPEPQAPSVPTPAEGAEALAPHTRVEVYAEGGPLEGLHTVERYVPEDDVYVINTSHDSGYLQNRRFPASQVVPFEASTEAGVDPGTPEAPALPIEVSPDDIPYDLAFEAHRNSSHTPERRAEQVRQEYVEHMQALHDSLAPLVTTDEARATLAAELERYRDGYLKRTRSILEARSRTASAMITGPANFPTRRNEKAIEVEMRRVREMSEWSKKAQTAIRKKLQPERGPVSSDRADAPEVIQQKIAEKEKLQETMVAANRIVRMKSISQETKIERLKELGMSRRTAEKLFEPDFANRIGFADYQLNNNRAEIKRLKDRLAEIETRRSETTTEVTFDGGTVVDNVEDNRLQIFFDGKPDADLRKKLKEAGFRWAPSVEAWQRKRGPNANAALQRVLGVRVEGQAEVREPTATYGARSITDSPAFRRWFGDSKVVDAQGKPLVVYHGSPVSDITEFRGGQTAYGIFFSDSLRSAAYYNPKADLRSPSENDVYAVYLKAANPADLRNAHVLKSILSEAGRLDEADEIAEYIERGELYNYDGRGRIQDEIVRTAEYMGHDAVILPDATSGELANSYIVFRPEQIKSATGNVGTFDPSDPSIVREGAANYNLFGEEEPAPAQPKQGDLFGAPEPSRRPQGLTEAEQEARQIVSVLAGKVGRGTATEAQLERYREAMALLERDQKLKPEDIAGRSEQETLPLDPRVGDLFDMLREGESLSPEQKKLATRLIREQFVLDFGSIEAARRAAAQTLREAGDLAVASHPALEMTEARKRLVAEARQTAFVSLAAKGAQIEVDADGKLVPESVFRLLRPYRSPLAEYMHAIVVAPDAEGNMRVVHHRAITSGAIDMVMVSMSDFAEAAAIAKRLGGQVLIAHNHPSGDPTPSPEDRDVTMRVVETVQAAGATFGGHYVINHETATLIGHNGQYLTAEPLRVPRESKALDWTDLYGEKVTGPASVVSYLSKLPVDDKRLDVLLLNTQHRVIAMDLRPLAAMADIAEWLPSLMREVGATTVVLGTGSRRAYTEAVAAANAHQWFPLLDIVDVGSGISAAERLALEPRFGSAPASTPLFERGPDYGGRDGESPDLQRQAGTPTEATDPDRPDATRVPGAAEGAVPLPGSITGAGAEPDAAPRVDRARLAAEARSAELAETERHSFGIPAILEAIRDTRRHQASEAVASDFEEVERRWQEAKGIRPESLREKALTAVRDMYRSFRRHFPHIDPRASAKHAVFADLMRQYEASASWAKAVAYDSIAEVVKGLDKNQVDTMTRVLALRDILRDIEEGRYEDKDLPFGYPSEAAVRDDLARFEARVEQSRELQAALEARRKFTRAITTRLVELDLLPEAVLKDDRYYHRQVMAYVNAQEHAFVGTGSRDVRNRKQGFQKGRTGGGDFNTAYQEAEFEWVSQALAQIARKETLERIQYLFDTRQALRRQAKQMNLEALREKLIAEGAIEPGDDPLAGFKQKIAMANSGLAKLAEDRQLRSVDGQFDDLIEGFRDEIERVKAANADKGSDEPKVRLEYDHEQWFPFLAHLLEHNLPGAMQAATVFRTIREREQFIQDTLGKDYLSWGFQGSPLDSRMVPEGYVEWQPEKGNHFFMALTVPEKVLDRAAAEGRILTRDDVREQLVIGGPKETWVIPEEIAATLEDFNRYGTESAIEKAWVFAQSSWKQWVLLNPVRFLKYNINNLSGDADVVAAYAPSILKNEWAKAARDLWRYQVRGSASPELRAEMQQALALRVLDSTLSVAEIPDINETGAFKLLTSEDPNLLQELAQKYWGSVRNLTTWRENTLRLAAFRHFQKEIAAGKKVYGASNRHEVDAIKSPKERAAKLAAELVGDYGNISQAGMWIRRHMIPFYSWIEINAPRYVRLLKNLPHEEGGRRRAVGVGASATLRLGAKAGSLAIRANMLMLMVALWNRLLFPDEEEELREGGREPHLILGRDSSGHIRTLRIEGALADALEWLSLSDYPSDIRDVVQAAREGTGVTRAVAGKAAEAVKGPVNRLVNSWEPFSKTLFEVSMGRSTYPSIFEEGASFKVRTRPIRDRAEHLTRTVSLDRLYRRVTGKPRRASERSALGFVTDLVLYRTDPGEAAYYDIRGRAIDYLKEQGREFPGMEPTERSNALYYYRTAVKWGDEKAADKWLNRYKELGGTPSSLSASIARGEPLSIIPARERRAFMESLSTEDRKTLEQAEAWYKATYEGAAPARRRRTRQRPTRPTRSRGERWPDEQP